VRTRARAIILLLTDRYPKWSAEKVSEAVMCSESIVHKTRKNCIEQGVSNRVYERSLDAKGLVRKPLARGSSSPSIAIK